MREEMRRGGRERTAVRGEDGSEEERCLSPNSANFTLNITSNNRKFCSFARLVTPPFTPWLQC